MQSKKFVMSKNCNYYIQARLPLSGSPAKLAALTEKLRLQWLQEKRPLYNANQKAKWQLNRERKKQGLEALPK